MTGSVDTTPNERSILRLTALADGSLKGRQRARLEAEVAASPALQEALARQRRAVAALRSLDAPVPPGLRVWIEAERIGAAGTPGESHRRRRRFRLRLSGGLAAAAVLLALVAALTPLGGAGGPGVVEAAQLGERPATQPAPRPRDPKLLAVREDGLPFPDWAEKFGWRASGARTDEIEGRHARTVFYEKDGHRIAYTIVSGEALDQPARASRAVRASTDLLYLRRSGRTIVTWTRDGRTCVLTGPDIPTAKLLDLAGWRGQGAVPF